MKLSDRVVRMRLLAWRPQSATRAHGLLSSLGKGDDDFMKCCVTISLVEEARGGPFVFWEDLATSCDAAAELGFHAIEIFPPAPDAIDVQELQELLRVHHLELAAVGTGAGWVKHGLTLSDKNQQAQALNFVTAIIDFAATFGASAIIGSMQGRASSPAARTATLGVLAESLDALGSHAAGYGVPLLFEPLNRYETNLCNTVEQGLDLIGSLKTDNVKLLADLFHMNIEEVDISAAIRLAGKRLGHVHFVDSNRRAVGAGHLNVQPVVRALHEIGYNAFLSAEALPLPDPFSAAFQTRKAFEHWCQ